MVGEKWLYFWTRFQLSQNVLFLSQFGPKGMHALFYESVLMLFIKFLTLLGHYTWKSNTVQFFGKKISLSKMYHVAQFWAQKLVCFVLGIHSKSL